MIWRALTTLCLMAALVFASFGHLTASPTEAAQREAYLLAGGDWNALCTDSDTSEHVMVDCMACVIAKTSLAPPVTVAPSSLGHAIPTSHAVAVDLLIVDVIIAPHRARAPPASYFRITA